MANFTPNRFGQINGSGDDKALFLKLFSGEVLATFGMATSFDPYQTVRTIANGKSAQFPVLGQTTAGYHTPGTEMLGGTMTANEKVILIDKILANSMSVADIDEAMTHFQVRQAYSREMGEALARPYDNHICRTIIRTARSGPNLSDAGYDRGRSGAVSATVSYVDTDAVSGDATFRNANVATNPDILANMFFKAAQVFDENNLPPSNRLAALRPAQYWTLLARPSSGAIQAPIVVNKDWGGQGGIAQGMVNMLAGIQILKSNNIPNSDLSADKTSSVTGGNSYAGDFTSTVALFWHPSAIGTVKLIGVTSETQRSARHLADIIVSRYACGHGTLRPEAAIEVWGSASAAADAKLIPA